MIRHLLIKLHVICPKCGENTRKVEAVNSMTIQPHVLVALGTAGTEQSWQIPAKTKKFTIQNKEGDTNIIYYFASSGGNPNPAGASFTLLSGSEKTFEGLFDGQTIYFQAVSSNNKNVVIEYYLYP